MRFSINGSKRKEIEEEEGEKKEPFAIETVPPHQAEGASFGSGPVALYLTSPDKRRATCRPSSLLLRSYLPFPQ